MRVFNIGVASAIAGAALFGSVGGISAQDLFAAEPPSLQFEREVRSTYIVRLDNSLPSQAVNNRAREVAARFGGRIKYTYTNAINGFAITMPSVAMARMIEAGGLGITSVTRDGIVSIDAKPDKPGKPGGGGGEEPAPEGCDQSMPWGVARVTDMTMNSESCFVSDRASSVIPDYGANSLSVCVIDTGVDLDHGDLNVVTDAQKMFTAFDKEGYDDLNGHGSHVAGIIGAKANDIGVVGVAPGANIVPVKVLNRRGSGSYSGVIAGVNWAAANGRCDIANMSLGGAASKDLDDAVKCAASTPSEGKPNGECLNSFVPSGVVFTLAAGNSGDEASIQSPARIGGTSDNIHTIAAMDKGDIWIYFSNFGSAVGYIEPGVSIPSTWKNGGYKTISGTSMAAPHMAGIVLRDLVNATTFQIEGPVARTGNPDSYDIAVSD